VISYCGQQVITTIQDLTTDYTRQSTKYMHLDKTTVALL